jgi:hypothetical protein
MHRPLWQIVLTLIILGFAVERGAAAVMAHYADAATGVVVMQSIFSAAGVVAAVFLWLWKGAKPEASDGPREVD